MSENTGKMPLISKLDASTWTALKHLHGNIAARIDQGEHVTQKAYLIDRPEQRNGQTVMQVAEVAPSFIDDLLSKEDGQRLVAKYLADALQEGSLIQQQIAREHGFQAHYTLCVQEAMLSQSHGSAASPVLMVLLHGKGLTLPIFHGIETLRDGHSRRCQLRNFPEIKEIEAVQQMLQVRMQQHNSLLH